MAVNLMLRWNRSTTCPIPVLVIALTRGGDMHRWDVAEGEQRVRMVRW